MPPRKPVETLSLALSSSAGSWASEPGSANTRVHTPESHRNLPPTPKLAAKSRGKAFWLRLLAKVFSGPFRTLCGIYAESSSAPSGVAISSSRALPGSARKQRWLLARKHLECSVRPVEPHQAKYARDLMLSACTNGRRAGEGKEVKHTHDGNDEHTAKQRLEREAGSGERAVSAQVRLKGAEGCVLQRKCRRGVSDGPGVCPDRGTPTLPSSCCFGDRMQRSSARAEHTRTQRANRAHAHFSRAATGASTLKKRAHSKESAHHTRDTFQSEATNASSPMKQ